MSFFFLLRGEVLKSRGCSARPLHLSLPDGGDGGGNAGGWLEPTTTRPSTSTTSTRDSYPPRPPNVAPPGLPPSFHLPPPPTLQPLPIMLPPPTTNPTLTQGPTLVLTRPAPKPLAVPTPPSPPSLLFLSLYFLLALRSTQKQNGKCSLGTWWNFVRIYYHSCIRNEGSMQGTVNLDSESSFSPETIVRHESPLKFEYQSVIFIKLRLLWCDVIQVMNWPFWLLVLETKLGITLSCVQYYLCADRCFLFWWHRKKEDSLSKQRIDLWTCCLCPYGTDCLDSLMRSYHTKTQGKGSGQAKPSSVWPLLAEIPRRGCSGTQPSSYPHPCLLQQELRDLSCLNFLTDACIK